MTNNVTIQTPIAAPKPARTIVDFAALLAVLAVLIVVFAIASPYFLTWGNVLNILDSVAVTGMIAAPVTMLLISGKFDLSVGSAAAFASAVLAVVSASAGLPLGVIAGIAAAVVVGMLNAYLVSVVKVSSLVATLGSMAIFAGLAQVLSNGRSLPVEGLAGFGSLRLPGGLPLSVLIFLVISAATFFALRFTVFGRSLYATGSNASAARLNGIRVTRLAFLTYGLVGLGVAVGMLTLTSQIGGYEPSMAGGLELSVLTAIVLGGASLDGGRGSMVGTVLGLLLVGTMSNGLVLLNIGSFWQGVAQGVLLICAVTFDQLRKRRSGAREA